MKNFCTFVASTTLMRGVQPAPLQGGFFCVPAKGVSSTYKRRPAFTEPVLTGITRASGVVDSGIVRAAFFLHVTVHSTHHVHHQTPARAGNSRPRRKADHSAPFNAGRGHHGPRFSAPASRVPRTAETTKRPAGKAASEVGIIRANPSHNSLIFINLRCRVAA